MEMAELIEESQVQGGLTPQNAPLTKKPTVVNDENKAEQQDLVEIRSLHEADVPNSQRS